MTNYDYIDEFRAAMDKAGIVFYGEIVPDGRLQRFHAESDKVGTENGWYILHVDEHPRGRFGSWKLNIEKGWASRHEQPMTPEQRQGWEKQIEDLRRVREIDQDRLAGEAAKRAQSIWDKAWPAPADHPYLRAKGIDPYDLRLHRGALVVPMRDVDGKIHSLHFIGADGHKRFLHDGKIDGNFHSLGDVKTSGRLWVAEGYATAATVHELTNEPVMAACNAGNLQAVAVALHERYPGAEMVIAADSDRLTKHNPGLTKALSAARDIDGKVSVPWFLDVSRKPTDWNDMMRSDGKELTRRALMGSVMTPERYIERTRQKDLTWSLHAEDNGWSREVVQRGIAQRTQERGFNRERSIGHER